MTAGMSARAVFDELLAALAGGHWHAATDLYARDVVVRNPFDEQGPKGRDAVEGFFSFLASRVSALRAEDVVVHETTDPEVVIGEFRFVGDGTDGAGFEMPALFVLRVRDGAIVESRDYLGPRRDVS